MIRFWEIIFFMKNIDNKREQMKNKIANEDLLFKMKL